MKVGLGNLGEVVQLSCPVCQGKEVSINMLQTNDMLVKCLRKKCAATSLVKVSRDKLGMPTWKHSS